MLILPENILFEIHRTEYIFFDINLFNNFYFPQNIVFTDNDFVFPAYIIFKTTIEPNFMTLYFLSIFLILMLIFLIFILKSQNKKIKKTFHNQSKDLYELKEQLNTEKKKSKITEKYNAQLKKELDRLQYTVNKIDNAVVIMDSQGTFEFVNEAFTRLYELSIDEFAEKKRNIFTAAPNERVLQTLNRCISDKVPVSYEFTDETKSGHRVWVQTTLSPMLNKDGEIERLIAVDTEITARKLAENEIKQQNEEISAQRDELEKKNYELAKFAENTNAALRYALTIQQATLPPIELLTKKLNAFVFFRPKDIVSGDFYWFSSPENTNFFFLAVTDCTGHGVPGAFMSLIGSRLLSEIVDERKIYKPSEILETLNRNVHNILNQQKSFNQDGMDISLCKFEKISDNRTKVTFAGAKQSIFYFRKKHRIVQKLRGDVKTIGGQHYDTTFFSDRELVFEPDDLLYLITDGILDQNSPERKKIGSLGFIKIIESISDLSIENQELSLISIFNNHRKNEVQRDDVTVIGIQMI